MITPHLANLIQKTEVICQKNIKLVNSKKTEVMCQKNIIKLVNSKKTEVICQRNSSNWLWFLGLPLFHQTIPCNQSSWQSWQNVLDHPMFGRFLSNRKRPRPVTIVNCYWGYYESKESKVSGNLYLRCLVDIWYDVLNILELVEQSRWLRRLQLQFQSK